MLDGSKIGKPAPLLFQSALLWVLLSGCSGNSTPAGPPGDMPPLPVSVIEVQPQSVPVTIEVMGQTEGIRETEVRAQVGGILLKRLYQEGETVRAGQALFQIDRANYRIALSEAQARANLAAREVKRLKDLVAQNAVSDNDYDNAVSNNAVAQAALRQANLNLSRTTVESPVSGVAGRALKSEGNLITSDDNLLTSVYQLNPIWVRFSLAQSDLAKLPHGRISEKSVSGVELILRDGSLYPKRGRLNYLASTVDPMLGTRQMRAEFPNNDRSLLPGEFVSVRLLLQNQEGVFLVPQVAVTQTDKGALLMLADAQNKVSPQPVQTGEWQGEDWVILGGLSAGDKVIVDNLIKLRPGMTVAPHPPAPEGGR